MSEEEAKRILEDMEKEGFPLEVRTSEILKSHNWEVTNQAAYTDIEKRKHRTVDIVAEKNVLYKPNDLGFDLWLVLECKKSTKPWVFYSSDFDLNNEEIRRKFVSSVQLDINRLAYQKKSHQKITDLIANRFLFKNKLSPPIFGKLAYASFVPFAKGEAISVHKAQMQVCGAILDFENKLESTTDVTEFPYGLLFVPIIVVDGQIYTYENEKLTRTDGLYYYMTFHDSAFMIEIFTIDFLERYLNTLEHIIENFRTSG